MFEAVIFDLDGTLLDTEAVALRLGHDCLRQLGHAPDPAVFHDLIGKDGPTSDAILRAAYPALDMATFDRMWRGGFEAALERDLPLKPFAAEVLEAIRLPKALCTSSRRDSAARKLGLSGLGHHFAAVVALEDVPRAKPDPAPYLLAAARLGVAPAACVVFEDSEPGAASAHAAGCVVVQVPDMLPASGRYAHHVTDTLIDGARKLGLMS